MFGNRADGRVNKEIDPIVRMTPVVMHQRCDAQVFLKSEIDYDAMTAYIHRKKAEGIRLTRMNLIVTAILMTLKKYPELNRFIMSKKIYERKEISLSYTVLKDDRKTEATIKSCFPLSESTDVFKVAEKMQQQISENKAESSENLTDRLAGFFLSIPGFSSLAFSAVRGLDKMGVLPKSILDASPFHTSAYITNTASIRLGYVYHHIYNFGTTSIFISIGQKEEKLHLEDDGKVTARNILPFGFTIDERICSGAEYAKGLLFAQRLLNHPELMEQDASVTA